MKKFIISLGLLFLLNCDMNPVTGGKDVAVLDIELTITEKIYTNSKLTANGIATNNSNSTIYPIWKIEGQFYHENNTGTILLLGGDNSTCTQNLQSNVNWNFSIEINCSNGVFNGQTITSIDDFYIADLRAIRD